MAVKAEQKQQEDDGDYEENIVSSLPPRRFPSQHDQMVEDVNLGWTRGPGRVFLAWIS